MTDKLYDRLPLEVAQVLRDAEAWRAHQRNHRDACAESALLALQESVDALGEWESTQERDDRVVVNRLDPDKFDVRAGSGHVLGLPTGLRLVRNVDDGDDKS